MENADHLSNNTYFHLHDVITTEFKLNYYLWPLVFVLLTSFYLFFTMAADSASSFNIVPEGKSWADIVEEDEEYDRLHPDQDFSDELDQTHDANNFVDTTSKTMASSLEKEETRGKKECFPVTNAEEVEEYTFDAEHEKKLETEEHAKLTDEQDANMENEQKAQEQKKVQQVDDVQEEAEKDLKAEKELTSKEQFTIEEEFLNKEESKVEEKPQDLASKLEDKFEAVGSNVEKDSKVQEPKIEKLNVEDEAKAEKSTTEEPNAKEVKDEEPEVEEPKVETPKPTGSMASKWATAASDPPTLPKKQQSPRIINAEVPSTSNSFKTGSMVSKWASAPDEPPARSYRRHDNHDRYGSNDRYNSRYNNSDRYGNNNPYGSSSTGRWTHDRVQGNEQRLNSGRLNRDYFEEKRQNENRGTFESRLNRAEFENPKNRYYDNADGRNGGFDNKENFSRVNRYQDYVERTKPEDMTNTPEIQEAINAWNTYKASEEDDGNDKKEAKLEEIKSNENAVVSDKVPTEDKPETTPLVEQSLPQAEQTPPKVAETPEKPIEEQIPSTFSWADDLPDEESESEETGKESKLSNLPVSSWGSLESPSTSQEDTAAAPKEDTAIATAPKEDTVVAPKEDTTIAPKEDTTIAPKEDNIIAPKEDAAIVQKEDTLIDSLEKNKPTHSWENVETSDEPSQTQQASVIEEKVATPVFTWGALDDYKESVKPVTPAVSDELPRLSEDQKEAAILAWNTVKLPEINDEGEEIIETASTPASAPLIEQNEELEASSSWNGESGWNTIDPKEELVPELPSWNMAPTPAAKESSIAATHSKQDWKSQLPPVVEDTASKWKSFAESIDVPPPRSAVRSPRPAPAAPPAVKEEPVYSWQSAPAAPPAVKEEPVYSWQSAPAAAKEETVHSWHSIPAPTDAPTNSWQSTPVAALATPQTSFAAPSTVQQPKSSQILAQTPSSLPLPQASSPQPQNQRSPMQVNFSFAELEKQPINVSFSMSELVNEQVKKAQNVSLSLSEFSDEPPARQPVNVSFSLSEFSNLEPEPEKKPKNNDNNDAPMSWGDFARRH